MITHLITIGDELLIGQTVNTNAAWIGQQLALLGIKVNYSVTISDTKKDIIDALNYASNRADLVLITGGLGPTKDDITKQTLCEFFDTTLELHTEIAEEIRKYFESVGKPFLEVNKQQAMLPKNCDVLENKVGTAAGMWFDKENTSFISMPGVPYEMKHIMETGVLPRVKEKFKTKDLFHYTVMTQGIGESFLAEKISDWEDDLRAKGLELAYLPSPGLVRLRISSAQGKKDIVLEKANQLFKLIPTYAYGVEQQTLAEVVGDLLLKKNKTISFAESCTGGYLSHLITAIPGSSAYYQGSIICYSYDIKEKELYVPKEILLNKGAVSEEVVDILSKELLSKYQTDYSIAISGIAGPDGGTDEKPVGTVWIAVRNSRYVITKKFTFGNDRGRNIQKSALTALNLVRLLILDTEYESVPTNI